jgi:hypothetical protein
MKIVVVSFINTQNFESRRYKKCIESQKEWASFHGMEYRLIEYSAKITKNRYWDFYCNYFDLEKAEDVYYLGLLPSVMILNKTENPFSRISWEGLVVNSITNPSFFLSKKSTNPSINEAITHSKSFTNIESNELNLGLVVISSMTYNYVLEFSDIHIGVPYIQGFISKMDMYLDTNKSNEVSISYTQNPLDADEFYHPGDFAVNIPHNNLFTKAYIKEFSLIKKQIDKINKIGDSLRKYIHNKNESDTCKLDGSVL